MYIDQKLKRILSKFGRLIRYFRQTSGSLTPGGGGKTAVITLSSNILNKDMGRYSFIICQLLKFSGFEVVLEVTRDFFSSNAPYKKMLLDQGFTLLRNSKEMKNTVVLYGGRNKKNTIHLNYGIELMNDKIDAYYLPYTLHPRFYQTYLRQADFEIYRNLERSARILFAGNFERALYSKSILKEKFPGTISRVEVLDHIDVNYADHPAVLYSTTKEHLYGLFDGEDARNKFIVSQARTPDADWLFILGKADFYLCLPGVRMPWSHNAFEAMAVGTIPIIQYNALFYPPLEHLKNCITFDSYGSLDEAIRCALEMSPEALALMRKAVIQYFDTYLATECTVGRIESFYNSGDDSMHVALPFLELN